MGKISAIDDFKNGDKILDLKVYITVHAYAEGRLNDQLLVPHSKHYGIHGKEIISPLRKINGKVVNIHNISDDYTVQEFWKWIILKVYGNDSCDDENVCSSLDFKYGIIEKYLIFNDNRYSVSDCDKPLRFYLQRMSVPEDKKIDVQLLICLDAGDVFRDEDNGIRYYMKSKESGRHHEPHVHVEIKHELSGTFSIITGEQFDGDKIREKYLRIIKNTILTKQSDFLKFWNECTDGLTVDLNKFLGIIDY